MPLATADAPDSDRSRCVNAPKKPPNPPDSPCVTGLDEFRADIGDELKRARASSGVPGAAAASSGIAAAGTGGAAEFCAGVAGFDFVLSRRYTSLMDSTLLSAPSRYVFSAEKFCHIRVERGVSAI